MLNAQDLQALGLPRDKRVLPLAMKAVHVALSSGADEGAMRTAIRRLCLDPAGMTADPVLGEVAKVLAELWPDGTGAAYTPRDSPAPWQQWGQVHVEAEAIQQMKNACALPVAVSGALMPDAHAGYGLPIGGVLAVRSAVIPFAVGVDIACRMRLSVLDWPVASLQTRREALVEALETETSFGVGAGFTGAARRQHAVMDEDWGMLKPTGVQKDKAWKQLGSSGGGNHFAEFGELQLGEAATIGGVHLEPGRYLALLSHSGSRGAGEAVATHYSQLAMGLHPSLPENLRHLAWLDLAGEPGQAYWAAMELMGRYASANHELIHRHILAHLGAAELTHVENHHNFAWKEEHSGEQVIVHRKGATPAGAGVQGVVPGSMGTPGFVIEGRGNEAALSSCSHGAGRLMSRTAAFRSIRPEEVARYLREHGVELLSGGLDEAPQAYKDINAVMAGQADLVDILARFAPRLVKMAPGSGARRFGKRRR